MSTRAATWLAWTTCALSLMLTGLSIGILVVLNLFDPDIPVFRYWTHLRQSPWRSRRWALSSPRTVPSTL